MNTVIKVAFFTFALVNSLWAKPYINLGAGAVFSNTNTSFTANSSSVLYSPTAIGTSLFSLPNVNWRNHFNNGFNLYAAAGYAFNSNWHSDIEFLYQRIQRHSFGKYDWQEQNSATGAIYASNFGNPIDHITKRANVYSFLTNLAFDFKNPSKWTPVLGVGIGLAWLRSGSTESNNILNIDDPSTPLQESAPARQISPSLQGTAFAWQFKAGLAREVSDSTMLVIQYRLFGTSSFKANNSVIISNPGLPGESKFYVGQNDIRGLLTHAIELNVRFNV